MTALERRPSDSSSPPLLTSPANGRDTEQESRLLGENVVLDYIRDSPMFRHQTEGFNDSLRGLKEYFTNVSLSAEMYAEAGQRTAELGDQLCLDLMNRDYSRSIFTNAHPELGPLSDHVQALVGILRQVNDLQRTLMERVEMGIKDTLLAFAEKELKDMDKLRKEVWRLGDSYEALLLKTLESSENFIPSPSNSKGGGNKHNNKSGGGGSGGNNLTRQLTHVRSQFELSRFDMVSYLNCIDGQKKVRVVDGVNRLMMAYVDFFARGQAFCQPEATFVRARNAALALAGDNFAKDVESWKLIRSRLGAELQGALPPPGAPLGALSPVSPREDSSIPPYLATLTTEVLGSANKNASYADLSHARDEGILKQGYLITTGLFNWNRKRRWYRLHDGKLYHLAVAANLDPQPVCYLQDATVSLVPGKAAPFSFVIVYTQPTSGKIELQAENEDDMVKWVTAIKRCQQRFQQKKHADGGGGGGGEGGGGGGSGALKRHGSGLSGNVVSPSSPSQLMADLRARNPTCCECDDPEIKWASFSIGAVLCEGCASVHRQLGHATSRLKSLEFDEWPLALLECFLKNLGNAQVNQVWEASIMNGWTRPTSKSPPETKQEWIFAKYKWYAFVEEDRGDKNLNSHRLIEAAATGDTKRAMWCIAHKGSPTWADVNDRNRTALHASTAGGYKATTFFLLVNGGHAVIRQADAEGQSPLLLARERRDPDILQLFVECERGDYL